MAKKAAQEAFSQAGEEMHKSIFMVKLSVARTLYEWVL